MRVLIAGDWHSDLHEQEMLNALRRMGHEVGEFKWYGYYTESPGLLLGDLIQRVQNKYVFGPALGRVNRDFVKNVEAFRPDVVFVYRGTHITRESLCEVRRMFPNCLLLGYNNDNPFSTTQPKYLWRHFMRATPVYDLMLAYRYENLKNFRAVGAKRVELLRSWYVPERNHPVALSMQETADFSSDVVFVGHYEPDERVEYLEEIVRQGHHLRLFGPTKYWAQPLQQSAVLRHLAPVRMVWGREYNLALSGSKIALCFFSKLNRDTYTRRCFEIPATRTLMLSEYSDDLASLYKEGVEADFFRSRDEMLSKIDFYLANEAARLRVAQAGYEKVQKSGHDIDARMVTMLAWINDIRKVHRAYA